MSLSPDNILIRPMRTEDIPAAFAIDKASAVLYWPESSYHFEVERNEASRPLVAVDETGKVLGFIVFWRILDEAHLANFAVDPGYRNAGIGRKLLKEGLRICREEGAEISFLEVRAGNAPAIHLYEAFGYETVSVRKGYYQDNHEDALNMNLDMKEKSDE